MNELIIIFGIGFLLAATLASLFVVSACMMSSRISREDGE